MMHRECNDCVRLWQEYAQATYRHIELSGKERIAHLQGDRETESRLRAEAAAAEKAREQARQAIREHEAVAHDETAEGEGRTPPA